MRLSGRALRRFVFWFVTALACTAVLIWFVMKQLAAETGDLAHPQSVLQSVAAAPAGAPALQPSSGHDTLPRQDLAQMREQENIVFEHLGWKIDPRTGNAAIPSAVLQAVIQRAATTSTRPATRAATAPSKQTQGGIP